MNTSEMKTSEKLVLRCGLDEELWGTIHALIDNNTLLGDSLEDYSLDKGGTAINFHTSQYYCGDTDHYYLAIPLEILDLSAREIYDWAVEERRREADELRRMKEEEKAAKEAAKAQAQAEYDRAEYARLKAKFESK